MAARDFMASELTAVSGIFLRPLTIADATQDYVDWMNDAQTGRFLESRFRKWTSVDILEYIKRDLASESSVSRAICLKADDRHIGNVRISKIEKQHGNGSIGILIGDKKSHGRGYGTAAIALMSEVAFETLGLYRLTAGIYATNVASIAAFRKAGYREEGRMRGRWLDSAERVDGLILGITRADWAASKSRI